MTASKTPVLGLMNPVGSDPFLTSDFADTFGRIDAAPGIAVVANQSARPTGWNSNQHGRRVWQADQNIEWVWNQPSSGSPGSWLRTFAKGVLANANMGSFLSTTNTNYATGITIVSLPTIVIPGGRPIRVSYWYDWVANDYGQSVISYWENGVQIYDNFHDGRLFIDNFPEPHVNSHRFYRNPAPSSQITMSFSITLAARNDAPPRGGGISTIAATWLQVEEV
jgi:hypothetical protein